MTSWWAVLGLAAAAALALPVRPRAPRPAVLTPASATLTPDPGWMRRRRAVWTLLGAVGAALFVGGTAGLVGGVVVAVGVWVVVGRSESPASRREREQTRRELPHVVTLLGAALRAGSPPEEAARLVCRVLPGPATLRLHHSVARLELGADPGEVWTRLALEPGLAPLGRTLARSHATGASVVLAVDRLGEELAREARAGVEDRARAVGVKAAVPLGLCLLPSFVLIGIVPVVAGLLGTLSW